MDFWQVHGWLFLFGLVFFPRLTMLFAGTVWKFALLTPPWNILAWVGWVLSPSLVVAILATTYYWNTNPILCIFAWLFLLSKTGGAASKVSSSKQLVWSQTTLSRSPWALLFLYRSKRADLFYWLVVSLSNGTMIGTPKFRHIVNGLIACKTIWRVPTNVTY